MRASSWNDIHQSSRLWVQINMKSPERLNQSTSMREPRLGRLRSIHSLKESLFRRKEWMRQREYAN